MNRVLLLIVLLSISAIAWTEDSVWLQIDTKTETLKIKRGAKTLAVLKHIAIGRKGAGDKSAEGDDITPLGNYKISWINPDSRYRLFFGFNYPLAKQAKKAYQQGLIDSSTYNEIIRAHETNEIPPQNTALGGQIGIHGLGDADPKIHRAFNWTHGCIAVTNRQIDYLSQWLQEGTRVEIK